MKMRINYYQVIQQANKISDKATRISNNIKKLELMIQGVPAAWKGPASQTFINRCELLKKEMLQTQRQTEALASTIRAVANRIRREDEATAARAKQLGSN